MQDLTQQQKEAINKITSLFQELNKSILPINMNRNIIEQLSNEINKELKEREDFKNKINTNNANLIIEGNEVLRLFIEKIKLLFAPIVGDKLEIPIEIDKYQIFGDWCRVKLKNYRTEFMRIHVRPIKSNKKFDALDEYIIEFYEGFEITMTTEGARKEFPINIDLFDTTPIFLNAAKSLLTLFHKANLNK